MDDHDPGAPARSGGLTLGQVLVVAAAALLAVPVGAVAFHGGVELTAPVSCGGDGCTRAGYAGTVFLLFGGVPVFVVTTLLAARWEGRAGGPGAFSAAMAMVALSFAVGLAYGGFSRLA